MGTRQSKAQADILADATVEDGLAGWQISAARAALGLSFLDISKGARVATAWLQRVERLTYLEVRETKGRGSTGVDRDALGRLLSLFRLHGLELKAAAGSHPASVACIDPQALARCRAVRGKGEP